MAAERRARAMGTDLTVIVVSDGAGTAEALADEAVARVEQLEGRWSRFRPGSEISRLNGAVGAPLTVSNDTATLVRRAIDAWRLSGGLVDCTLLDELVEAGYDRPFHQLPWDRPRPAATLRRLHGHDPGDIHLDGHTVGLPLGLGIDPGGVGKGLAADLVTAELMAAGAAGAGVNLGGDLRVRGLGPGGGAWTISIDHPHRVESIALIGLHDGAMASSTTLRRRWKVGGRPRHHLIDPRTGQGSHSRIAFACAVASEGWQAEAMAKTFLLRGASQPFVPGGDGGVEGLVVDRAGTVTVSPGFARFTGGMIPAPTLPPEVVA